MARSSLAVEPYLFMVLKVCKPIYSIKKLGGKSIMHGLGEI